MALDVARYVAKYLFSRLKLGLLNSLFHVAFPDVDCFVLFFGDYETSGFVDLFTFH